MSASRSVLSSIFEKRYFLPTEHGSWIWWLGPLLIGTVAAGGPTDDTVVLILAGFAAFLLRQPTAFLVKILSGRRPRRELPPTVFWIAVYTLLLVLAVAALVWRGHEEILVLAVPGVVVFIWHLWLIARRSERGQRGIELVGSGVLALAAPAAYWVSGGVDPFLPWILWIICWLQSAASIVNVYNRLELRGLDAPPSLPLRRRSNQRSLIYHAFNVVLGMILATTGWIPWLATIGFLLMLIDAIDTVIRPPIGASPRRIGFRQLAASSVFVILVALGFSLR